MNKKIFILMMILLVAGALMWRIGHGRPSRPDETSRPAEAAGYQAGISLSVNHTLHTKILRGWPVIVQVFLIFPEGSDLPSKLEKSWRDQISFELRTEKGLQPASFQPGEPLKSATAVQEAKWTGVWILAPEATQALEPGMYQLKAVLKDQNGVLSKSYFSKIEVLAESGNKLQPEAAFYFKAEALILQKRLTEAKTVIDSFLQQHPNDLMMTQMKADIARAEGKHEEALELYDKLVGPVKPNEPPSEEFMRKRHEMLTALLVPDSQNKTKGN